MERDLNGEGPLRLAPGVRWHREGEEPGYLFSSRSGGVFVLNRTAAAILAGLEGGAGAGELADDLAGRFDVAPDVAHADVVSFLAALREHELAG